MTLQKGVRLGPYEILDVAGAGGMGEVYKAKDTRLDRTVAIKVLPGGSADNPDLRQRLEREAKAVSSLNHPNICILYDVGHQDGIDYLVMEYLEGETLATRLEGGPLSRDEVLRYALQIADALDKAHKQGLVHRDLKPGNIMLTKSGAKLLDFGLAKLAASNDVVQGMSGVTRTTPLTGQGTILGTLHYMPPEQLEGKEADARSDIFAFGCVLYEMATGKRAFEGKSQASLIAAILKEQPKPISELQPLSPPMLDRVIKQCMEKDPDDRWNSAGDVKRALQWVAEGGSQVGLPAVVSAKRRVRERALWGAVALLTLAAGWLGVREFLRVTPKPQVARFTIEANAKLTGVTWPKISPDGSLLAYTAIDSAGQNGLWIRPLNSLDAHLLVTLAGASSNNPSRPFWSPDSKQLAYFEGSELKKVSVAGGMAQLVCQAVNGSDGSWGNNGVIIFDGSTTDSVRQVSAAGGIPQAASRIDRSQRESYNAWPMFLPDGEHFLFLAAVDSMPVSSLLKVGSVKTLESTVLGVVDSRVEYSTEGYVLYLRAGLLVAHPFDPKRLKFAGEPIPIANQVAASADRTQFGLSDNGILVYQAGQSTGSQRMLWLNRKGDSLQAVGQTEGLSNIALSPDGGRVAYQISSEDGKAVDVWVRDLSRNVTSRLTFGPGTNAWPVWSPDGLKVMFASSRGSGRFHAFEHFANGTGSDEEICKDDTLDFAITSVSRDASMALVLVFSKGLPDLMLLRFPAKTMEPLLVSPFAENRGALSPDGKYYAYQSDESGRPEVYVRELATQGGKWQISTNRGRMPVWRDDGGELFYVTPDNDFMAVPISDKAGFEIGTPTKLFNRRYDWNGNGTLRSYQVSSDGQRLLVVVPAEEASAAKFVVVQNWTAELGR